MFSGAAPIMRILHAITYYWPHWTGLAKVAQRLAEGHAARGHQVSVLTSRHLTRLPRHEQHNGVDIYRLRQLAHISRGVVMPTFPFAAWDLLRRHDLVLVHLPMLETWIVTAMAKQLGKPSVALDHGDLIMPAGIFNQFVQRSVRFLMSRGLDQASAVTTHTEDYAQQSEFLRPYLHKVHAIYPPIDFPYPDPAGTRKIRERFALGNDPVVGFAGRFVEEKGFDYLLQAVPLVAEQVPNVHFAFAGERFVAYEDFYRRWAHLFESQRDRVVALGLLTDPQELANFYGACNAIAIPSRTDCFPILQVEAMLVGTPVVTTNIPGARVAIRVTGAGHLVEPRDPRALADGLIKVLADPSAYVKPRAEIEAVLGIERSLDSYEDLFRSLMSRPSPAVTR